MPRNRSEKIPEGYEDLNDTQREYMRCLAQYALGIAASYGKLNKLWAKMSNPEQLRLSCDMNALITFYKEQHLAAQ